MPKILGIHVPDGIKNYIINGDMSIAQRGTSFVSPANGSRTLDRYVFGTAGAAVATISQDTDVPSFAQAGYSFASSYRSNLTTPDTAIAASDFYLPIQQRIEGYNWANLAGKPFTISFWVKATTPGIRSVALKNTASDRSYVAEYTINGSETWEYKVINVPAAPFSGTWNYTTGVGLFVIWSEAAGSNFQTTPGSWQTGNFLSTANCINGANTGSTNFRITGIMVSEGTLAFPFRTFGEDYPAELAACQRYFEKSYDMAVAPGTVASNGVAQAYPIGGSLNRLTVGSGTLFKTRKRATPTMTYYNPGTGTSGQASSYDGGGTTPVTITSTSRISEGGISDYLQLSGSATAGQSYLFHWTAESEI